MLKKKRNQKVRAKGNEEQRDKHDKTREGTTKIRRNTGRLSRTRRQRARREGRLEIMDHEQVGGRYVAQLDPSRGHMDENGSRGGGDNA